MQWQTAPKSRGESYAPQEIDESWIVVQVIPFGFDFQKYHLGISLLVTSL
jgi:hypothetical protein